MNRFTVPLNGYDAQFCQCVGEDEECPICFPFVCEACECRMAERFACLGCLRNLCQACWRGQVFEDDPWCFDCLHPTCACGALLVFAGLNTAACCDDCALPQPIFRPDLEQRAGSLEAVVLPMAASHAGYVKAGALPASREADIPLVSFPKGGLESSVEQGWGLPGAAGRTHRAPATPFFKPVKEEANACSQP